MTTVRPVLKATLRARYDEDSKAVLDELAALHYSAPSAGDDVPEYVRAASAVRRFQSRLVIVQDDVDALAVQGQDAEVERALLPRRASGRRRFDAEIGNKKEKMDLEAGVVLTPDCFVAFGSGSKPLRERVVLWDGKGQPQPRDAHDLYASLRAALDLRAVRLNIEGVAAMHGRLLLFHRGNDPRAATPAEVNAVIELDLEAFRRWLAGAAREPDVESVTPVELGAIRGVRFGFSDVAAVGDALIVLACAEDSDSVLDDGVVLGCRVGVWNNAGLRTVDVVEADGAPTRMKLEGIEMRPGRAHEFDVVVDVDSHRRPAQLGRLTWQWR